MEQLKRIITLRGAIWMGLGSILGTGVFVSLGLAAGVIHDGLLWALALAALIALANGLSSAQLAAAHPVSGGTYEYARRFIHPMAGFAAGWLFLAAKSASAAAAAKGLVGYLLKSLGVSLPFVLQNLMAVALILGITRLIAGGLDRSNRANQVFVLTTLFALGAFVVFGALTALPDVELWFSASRNAWADPQAFMRATALLFVAYTGYGRIATLGEEVIAPQRTIPRAIMLTLLCTMGIYLAVAWTALSMVGASRFATATYEHAAPLEQIARGFSFEQSSYVIALGAMMAMAGVVLNLLLGLSRVVLAMARQGDLPQDLAFIDAKTSSPTRAIWSTGLLISALALIGDLYSTWSFSAFSVLLYYGITNWAALYLPKEHRRYPRLVTWFGLLGCVVLALFVKLDHLAVGLVLLTLFMLWRRYRKRSA